MKKIIYFSTLLLITISTIKAQSRWKPVGSPTGANINSIIEKDGYIFTAAGPYWSTGAVYRSADNGKTWELKINNLPANFTILDLAGNNTYIYTASSAGGVYRSSDYGESWESTGFSGITYTIHTDGNNIIAGTPSGIYRSSNNGSNWENISSGLNDNEVYVIYTINDYLFAGTSNGVYRSQNGGNWSAVNNGINSQYRYIYSLSHKDGYMFTGLYNRVYRSSDFGNSWQEITNGSDGAYALKTYDNKIYKTNYYGLHYSTNNGQSWTTMNNTAIVNQYLMDVYIDGNLILTGEKELIRSENHGSTWSFSSAGIANLNTGPIIKKDNIFYSSAENVIYKSYDNGLTWIASETLPLYTNLTNFYLYENYIFGASASGSSVRSLDGEIWEQLGVLASEFTELNGYLFASRRGYTGTISRSSDLGLTWVDITTPMLIDISGIAAFNSELYIGGFSGLFKSNDNGNNWTQINFTTMQNSQVQKLYVHNNYLFVDVNTASGYFLFRSDNGTDWTFYQSSLMNSFNNTFESYGNILIAASYNNGILISHDNGENWEVFNEGFPVNSNGTTPLINSIYAIDNQLFASVSQFSIWNITLEAIPVELSSFIAEFINTEVILKWQTASETNNRGFEIERRLFTTKYGIDSWETIGFLDGYRTTSENKFYFFADKNLHAGVYNYRLKQLDFDGSFEYSDVVRVEVTAPDKFALEQNYPNPFNPVTKIKYHIPMVGTFEQVGVLLRVYDILGNEVVTLVDDQKKPGVYEVFWDAAGLSSGPYFYILEAGQYTEVKKLLLLK
jgi:photosystem II stability/assembly factor-like uncharacterized protein